MIRFLACTAALGVLCWETYISHVVLVQESCWVQVGVEKFDPCQSPRGGSLDVDIHYHIIPADEQLCRQQPDTVVVIIGDRRIECNAPSGQ